jgi:4-amino-4-deoxy-L-arabinose transferase-like glycosyltransferase
VRELVRKSPRFFSSILVAGVALRLLFLWRFPAVTADSFVYGDIAKNWLQHGIYGLSGSNGITPTYIRLPGYPAFLAVVFAVFGMEHYKAALALQMLVDVGTCFLTADLARRMISSRAAKVALLLSALCPFLANYSAAALTETWEIFFTVAALDLAIAGLENPRPYLWPGSGLATGAAILLRPDGVLLLVAIEFFLCWRGIWQWRKEGLGFPVWKVAIIFLLAAVVPLVPWTVRNLRTFHQFQPLAPRYANEEKAFVPRGFERWMRTWIADYASTEEIYWSVPGSQMDPDQLPARAFDNDEQREQTQQLLADYNQVTRMTPELDQRFGELARERVRHSPVRYYLTLPALRIADMWLRPRTEILPCNTRWWEFDEDTKWLVLNLALGGINLIYIGAALAGIIHWRAVSAIGLLLTFVILRSAFLGTLENPEPRYTLECYPIVIVLAAVACSKWKSQPAS